MFKAAEQWQVCDNSPATPQRYSKFKTFTGLIIRV